MAHVLRNTAPIEVNENLYLNEETADVHFVLGVDDEIEKVPVNKASLTALSPVFEVMFNGSLPEKGDVRITDADADGFKEFLQFFYLDEVRLTMANIETVIRLADKYDILQYVNAVALLKTHLTLDNMCWGYQLAIELKSDELIRFCELKIAQSPKEVFATDTFLCCDKTILKRILELDLMCMAIDMFAACLAWAEYACKQDGLDETQAENLRTQLGDCLKLIPFVVMKLEEFNQFHVFHKGLFTVEEYDDIMLSITTNICKPEIFNQNPKCIIRPWNVHNVLQCRRKSGRDQGTKKYIQNIEVTSFTSNSRLLLGAIHTARIYNSVIGTKVGEIEIIINEHVNSTFYPNLRPKILYQSTSVIWCGAENRQMMVELPRSILINPFTMYEIRLNIRSTNKTYYYSDCKETDEIGDGIKVYFRQNPTLDYDNLANGWISDLIFNKF